MTAKRHGFTLIEVTLAIGLLAVAMVAATQVLTASLRQRAAADRQFTAQIEASNVAERIAAMEYDAVTPETVQSLTLPSEVQSSLPSAKLNVTCNVVESAVPPHKKIAIELAWAQAREERRTVRLTTFKYAPTRPKR